MKGANTFFSASNADGGVEATENASSFEYKYDAESGGVILTKYKNITFDVIIPSVIENYPVVKIGCELFENCRFRSVNIPGGITSIGDYAFYNCNSSQPITIPDSVKKVGFWAFRGCYTLSDDSAERIRQINPGAV